MATPTTNLRLLKPTNIEQYDLQTMNLNFDTIDEKFGIAGSDRLFETSLSVGNDVMPSAGGIWATEYAATEFRALRWGNWCHLRIEFTHRTATTVSGTGAIGTTNTLGTLLPKWWPLVPSPLSNTGAGRGASGYVSASGVVVFMFATGSANFAIGNTTSLSGWYMLADGI